MPGTKTCQATLVDAIEALGLQGEPALSSANVRASSQEQQRIFCSTAFAGELIGTFEVLREGRCGLAGLRTLLEFLNLSVLR